jgi:hypothetical protein
MTTRTEALQGAWTMEPLDGDAGGIRRHATRYTRLAEKVGTAVTDLKRAIADAKSHESEAMTELATQSDEVIPHLAAIQDRYETAGSALSTFADVLDQAQSDVTGAIAVRESTADTVSSYDAQITEAEHAMQWATIEELESRRDELTRLENAVEPLTQTLLEARTSYDGALAAVEEAGDVARRKIDDAVDADGLTDSRWDSFKSWVTDNAGWISTVKEWMAGLTAVLGVLSIFFPFLAPFALGLALATMALSAALASTGNGSWLDFALDTVTVLTLGIGAAAGTLMRGTQAALRIHRTSRVAWQASRRPGVFGTLARPVRAVAGRSAARSQIVDDFARALPDGVTLTSRPRHLGNLENVWATFRAGGVDGVRFQAIAQNAKTGSGGLVDDLIVGLGNQGVYGAQVATWAGVGGTIASYHDDLAQLIGSRLDNEMNPAIRYAAWWREVDASTIAPLEFQQ